MRERWGQQPWLGRGLLTLLETGVLLVRLAIMWLMMAMNGWVFLALVLGAGAGYLLAPKGQGLLS